MVIYAFQAYRDFLRAAVAEKKRVNPKHTYSWLADQIGVQRSYFSRALKGSASLSSDQAYLMAKALRLTQDERDYLLLLLEIDKTSVKERRLELEAKRSWLQAKKNNASAHLKRSSVAPQGESYAEYYSQPQYSIVHMYLTIPKYLERPMLLKEELGLSAEALTRILGVLEGCGIIRIEGKSYRLLLPTLHVSGTRLSRLYATQFRLKAIECQQKFDNDRDYFFTSSFSANESAREEIKEKFLEFLGWVGKKVEKAESEEVFHLNFDLFKV